MRFDRLFKISWNRNHCFETERTEIYRLCQKSWLCLFRQHSCMNRQRKKTVYNSILNSEFNKSKTENLNSRISQKHFSRRYHEFFQLQPHSTPSPLSKQKCDLTSNALLQVRYITSAGVPNIGKANVGYRLQSDLFLFCIIGAQIFHHFSFRSQKQRFSRVISAYFYIIILLCPIDDSQYSPQLST